MERIAMFMTTYILVNLKVLLGNYEFALSTFTVITPNESTMQANVSKTHTFYYTNAYENAIYKIGMY